MISYMLLPVIKDFLKDIVANAEMLSAHKVDTSEYRKQVETENVKQESDNEPLKKTEGMEQKKEEQKQEVQQPQTAELLRAIPPDVLINNFEVVNFEKADSRFEGNCFLCFAYFCS